MEDKFKSILPSHSSKALKVCEEVLWRMHKAYEEERNELVRFEDLLNYKKYSGQTDDSLFDAFSLSVGVEVWDLEGWSKEKKAELLGKTIAIKKSRGTELSLKMHFEALDLVAEIIEWYDDAYLRFEDRPIQNDFKVIVSTKDNEIFRIEARRYHLKRIIEELKPLRTTYELFIEQNIDAAYQVASGLRMTKILEVYTSWGGDMSEVGFLSGVVLKSVVTNKGLEEMARILADPPLTLSFTKIELGTESWNPRHTDTSLKSPMESFPVIDSRRIKDSPDVHVTSRAASDKEYTIGEVGIYAKVGEEEEFLFAIMSEEGKILTKKVKNDTILLAYNIALKHTDSGAFSVEIGERLNLQASDWFLEASKEITSLRGVIESLESRLKTLEDRHA